MSNRIELSSDNRGPVHPVVEAEAKRANEIVRNHPDNHGYGNDPYTEGVIKHIQEILGRDCRVVFVSTGTAANTLAVEIALHGTVGGTVIAPRSSHISQDENGAISRRAGVAIREVLTPDGKLTPDHILPYLGRQNDVHHNQPSLISITQPSEYGTVYTPEEVTEITEFAHKHNLYVHMDGARLANAAAALETEVAKFTAEAGIDILTWGVTKSGGRFGESVILLNPELIKKYDTLQRLQKQMGQMHSKTHELAAEYGALLHHNLIFGLAHHSNTMAEKIENGILQTNTIEVAQSVDSFAVFASLLPHHMRQLAESAAFYEWEAGKDGRKIIRLVPNYTTTREEVNDFVNKLKALT